MPRTHAWEGLERFGPWKKLFSLSHGDTTSRTFPRSICHTHVSSVSTLGLTIISTSATPNYSPTHPNWTLGRECGWWWRSLSWGTISLGHWSQEVAAVTYDVIAWWMACRETKMLLTHCFPVALQAELGLQHVHFMVAWEKRWGCFSMLFWAWNWSWVPVKFGDVRVLLLWFKQACFHEKGAFF